MHALGLTRTYQIRNSGGAAQPRVCENPVLETPAKEETKLKATAVQAAAHMKSCAHNARCATPFTTAAKELRLYKPVAWGLNPSFGT